jgi:Carboxypeptidase regulatory-like domain/TonB-dependent Receptor Plug Domain
MSFDVVPSSFLSCRRVRQISLLCLFFSFGITYAQEVTGTILGTVTDSSGAVVPQARITITNVGRNTTERSLRTSSSGSYTAPLLPIGTYSVKIEAKGYKTYTETNIVLNVNDKLSVSPALTIGNITETVTVEANALQVDTQSAAATGLITGTQIRELALQSRNYEQLVALMPGVSSDIGDFLYAGVSAPSGATNETAFSLNGSFGTQNNWSVDGADNVDRGGNFSLLNYPSVDAIEEFKVLRGNYNAEYGRSSGGQINVITRSGQAKFHGNLYEFFRNDVLNANTWENNQSGTPRAPLRYNDFGGTFGGPVFIPNHYNKDRNKTFFFFSEEARRVVESSSQTSQVPNLQERGLDPATGGNYVFPYPVCTGQLATDSNGVSSCPAGQSSNTILASQINPAAMAYIKDVYGKVPTPQDTQQDLLTANVANIFNYRQEILRLDHTFNPKWSAFARWINDSIPTQEGGGLFNANLVPNVATTSTQSPGKNIVAGITTTFTPTLINQIEYAWSYGAILSTNIGPFAAENSPDVVSTIQLPSPVTLGRIPSLSFGAYRASMSGFGSYKDYNKNHNIFDNLTKIVGRHSLKFGVTYYHYQKSENSGGNNAGTFTFQANPDLTLGGIDGDPAAEWHQEYAYFLLGQSNSFTQLQQDIRAIIDQNQFEAYGQDEFRLRPNLTIGYGLRYSLFRQPTDAQGHATSFDPTTYKSANAPVLDGVGNLCTPGTQPCYTQTTTNPSYDPLNGIIIGGQNSPYGTAISKQVTLSFAPRIGVAWDPYGNSKTSVRTGYGIFIESPGVGFVENAVFSNPPFVGTTTIYNAPLNNPLGGVAAINNNPPPLVGTAGANFHQPYTQQWNLDIQRQLPDDILFDIGYYGSKGTHLIAVVDINQPQPGAYLTNPTIQATGNDPGNPLSYVAGQPIGSATESLVNLVRPYQGYAGIDSYLPIFKSNYHSLQASLQKRFSQGSLITVNYTWSKNLTNVPYDPNYTVVQNTHDLPAEYSYSRFDQRHVFNTNLVYQLPFFHAQQGFTGRALGGWEFSGIYTANSGHWLDPVLSDGEDPAGLGIGTGVNGNIYRPNQVGDPNAGALHKADQWFNSSAFTTTLGLNNGQPGNAKKNSILGPGRWNLDFSLLKNIRVFEQSAFQFRLETFNSFNHTSFSNIDTNANDGTSFGAVQTAHQPRIVQLGLKFSF